MLEIERVGKILYVVAGVSCGQRLQPPAPLDQLQDRGVVEYQSAYRGSSGCPALNGEATTVGTRKPSRALPFTRSGSTLFGAAARGGTTCSKKPPHSSKFTMKTVLRHFGPFATASNVSYRKRSPLRISAWG